MRRSSCFSLHTLTALTLVALQHDGGLFAQQNRTSEFALFAEPLAVGVQYLIGAKSLGLGLVLCGGSMTGVGLADEPSGETDAVASAHVLTAYHWQSGRLLVGPIGAALLSGGDFSAVYPSAQAGIDLARGRWRFGSHLRVIRIAGPNNTADYWTEWLPVRIGYTLTR